MQLCERKLPAGLVNHMTTREFSSDAYPEALGREHSTKPGVWGVLNVTAGSVTFWDKELDEDRVVNSGETQVITPASIHSASPGEGARFFVEFYRNAAGDSGASNDGGKA